MSMNGKRDLKRFAARRDKAFTKAVLTDDFSEVRSYCNQYSVPLPKDERVMKAGVYKAVQVCTAIPEEVKAIAREKCIALGFKPTIEGVNDG